MRTKYISLLFLFFISSQGILAQNTADLPDSSGMSRIELGEVTIRASRANIKLKEMHASVSLLSSAAISENEIHSLREISSVAPNLFMPDYGSKLTSPVYIRGVGSRINAPSVGLYVDNVPHFEKAAFDFDFYDMERIEVLRGPQGTLYGRNTMGGIINIFTLSPMNYQGSYLQLSAGNYGQYAIHGGHYRKINDHVALSLAANFVHNDGFFTNRHTGDRVDKMNSFGSRMRLVWKISEKATLENIAGFESSRQGGYPYALFNDSLNKAESINYNHYSYYNRDIFSDALVFNYNTDKYEIISTTAYQLLDDIQKIDQDFTPDTLYYVSQTQLQHALSQEVTARSVGQRKYNWLFGVYGFFQYFDNAVDVDMYVPPMRLFKQYDHSIAGFALFHQSVIHDFLIKNLSVTGGIRLDFEKDILAYRYDREMNELLTNLADTVYPSLKSLEVLPKIALNYKKGRNNYYVVVAKGYKTGGFNSTFERPGDLTFDPEQSWNYEAGAKTSLLKDRLYADIAVFYINWKNQQIYQTVPSGRGSMLKNAGHSSSKGFEATLRTNTTRGCYIMIAYGYTHAAFLEHRVDATTDYSGNFIPYVPRHTLAVQLNRSFQIKGSALLDEIGYNLLYRGAGELYWNEKNSHRQGYYGLLDARISLRRNVFQLDIWGRNLFNTGYEAFYFEALGNKYVQAGKPFQFGFNASFKF